MVEGMPILKQIEKQSSIEKKVFNIEEENFDEKGELKELDKSFDLIISDGVIPNIYFGGSDVREKVKKSFSEMLRVLKDGGEIHLKKVLIGHKQQKQMVMADSIEGIPDMLESFYDFKITKTRTPKDDDYQYDRVKNEKGLFTESFLIIIKKLEKGEEVKNNKKEDNLA